MSPFPKHWHASSTEMTVLALVAACGEEGIEPANLHAAQRRITKRPKEWLDALIAQCLTDGLLEDNAGFLSVPDAIRGEVDPAAQRRAEKHLGALQQTPLAQRVQERDEAILALLTSNGRVPLTTALLWENLGGNSHSSLRMLQRNLARLEQQLLIVRQDHGWVAAPRLEPKHFEDRAAAVALNILLTQFKAAIPKDIVASLEPILERARKRIGALPTDDPRIRWLEAMRLAPGYPPQDSPLIKPQIAEVIERAILTRTRVWLRYSESSPHGTPDRWDGEVSISHYILQVPAHPAIVCWEKESGRAHRIHIHDIEEISLCTGRAHWPEDYEPNMFPPLIRMRFGDADANQGLTKVVLLVGERTLRRLQRRMIGQGLKAIPHEPDQYGRPRYIVTLRVALDVPTLGYIQALDDTAILAPRFARKHAQSLLHLRAKRYQETHELAAPYLEQQAREEASELPG